MREARLMACAALAALSIRPGLPVQPDANLVLRAVRSYRAAQGRTEVNAFVQVPYSLLEPTGDGPEGALSYQVTVKVTDSTGLTLLQNAWQNHAIAQVRRPDAFAVDMVHFSIAPGRYRLDVTVEDSVSGHRATSAVDLEGFRRAPPASDLLLSPQIRPATATDTVPQPAELRWGKMLVTAAARLQLTPLRSTAYYLLEAYSEQEASGTLALRVADSSGAVIIRTPPQPVRIPQGGGVLKGQLDLAGLPAGPYTMTAGLVLGSDKVERSATFLMAGLEETLSKDVARREAAKVTDEGYFAAMAAAQLDAAEDPLAAIVQSGELSAYSKDLSNSAKRRFLSQFWQRRDPTPETPVNEARDAFYKGIVYANEHYREGGRTRPGWKSDRGRVFLRNGPPEEVLQRREGRSYPYEVWRYRQGKDRYYIFLDRSGGVGLYQLIHSNDIKEPGVPDWKESLHKVDALVDISRFLGIEFTDLTENQYR
jgi:GWxTD domain-containing protein